MSAVIDEASTPPLVLVSAPDALGSYFAQGVRLRERRRERMRFSTSCM
jgi:hypothetical protein